MVPRLSPGVPRPANSLACSAGYGWNPITNPVPPSAPWLDQTKVTWPDYELDLSEWLSSTEQDMDGIRSQFEARGYAILRDIVPPDCLQVYRTMHEDMQSGTIRTPGRHDLGSHKPEAHIKDRF
ncbi:hypothetical protein CYMTET_6030 [Cymbomonas tetramitiformis]|uniref:Uncharacterized protein n=1 Tax=Cymbomonas tetramitiformis TaxID=36881 RepID=A0AAE0LIW8_9CHLO|nr:hypothetical protein CYMTET_6030 [Cymbomonas tetramitiformis]